MFYKINGFRFSFREFWWSSRWNGIIAGAFVKLGRTPIPVSSDDPNVDSLASYELINAPLPEQVAARFQPLIQELQALGFHSPVFHEIIDPFHSTKIYFANFCHESGRVFARIHHRIWTTPHPPRVYLFPIFISAFDDGTFLVSSAGKADMESPKTCPVNRLKGAATQTLWDSHQRELEKETIRKSPLPQRNQTELRDTMEWHHVAVRDFHLRRGVFSVISQAEQQEADLKHQDLQALQTGGVQHPEVIAELNRLQAKQAGWGNIITIFLVSLFMFILIGARQWSWNYTLILIPVLLVHELGHYIAMRTFRYRNLKMFFIPFFGAAVSGRHYNVPGWKKAVVSLMGPVPGIFIGTALGLVGLFLHHALLLKIAMVTLILNGFNLIPVLPLDGGWVMHSVLFSRHYLMDVAFRVVAALAMLGISILLNTKGLMYVGILGLVTLPALYRIAKITDDLRRQGIGSISPDDQTVPPATADIIITEVKKAFPKRVTNKILAQHTLTIFESLNSRPPNWLATIGLVTVQVGSIVIALAFAILFTVAQSGNVKNFFAAAATQPRHALTCGSGSLWEGKESTRLKSATQNTIIATFKKHSDAEAVFADCPKELPATAAARVFGESLMITFPTDDIATRKLWFNQLEAKTTNTLVTSSNVFGGLSLYFIAPNKTVAAQLTEELTQYTSAPSNWKLIPPWATGDERSIALRAQHSLARATYAKILKASYSGYKSPELAALRKRINQTRKQGDMQEYEKLVKEQTALIADLSKQSIEQLKANSSNKVDVALIDLYLQTPRDSTNWSALAMKSLAPRLGQLPSATSGVTAPLDHDASRFGSVKQNGLLIQINWMSFEDPFQGCPALVEWLCNRNCMGFKYDLDEGSAFDLDD